MDGRKKERARALINITQKFRPIYEEEAEEETKTLPRGLRGLINPAENCANEVVF